MISNNMRIGGLASGMDIDQIVADLMKAERIPLTKMQQDKTWLTWKRDAYREINTLLFELDQMALDMKLSKTYQAKSATSTDESAVTVSASPSALNGNYKIKVEQMATAAIKVSTGTISGATKIDPDDTLANQSGNFDSTNPIPTGDLIVKTFDENGNEQTATITISHDKSLNEILSEITNSGIGVRAFYNQDADQVVFERTETGDFKAGETEIQFDGAALSFITDHLKIDTSAAGEIGGTNARFIYNDSLTIETTENHYTLNGITYNFHNTTSTNVQVSVNNHVDQAVENITNFIDKYNEIVEKINGKLTEKRHYDYKPLTSEQKADMEEDEIELWEERAKSGLLRSDQILSSGLFDMRQAWYSVVETNDSYQILTELGIETSKDFLSGGKLTVDEDQLRQALTDDPEAVYKLFSNDVEGNGRGIVNRLEDALERTMNRIEERAGKGTDTLDQYTMGRRLKDMDKRITAFQQRLIDIENRYWNQFTVMEKAIQRMNQQSMFLMNQFGGGM